MYCTAPLSPREGRLRSFRDDDDDDSILSNRGELSAESIPRGHSAGNVQYTVAIEYQGVQTERVCHRVDGRSSRY